jgi:hypothetical protein
MEGQSVEIRENPEQSRRSSDEEEYISEMLPILARLK